jgi:hypothetical protein
MGKYRIVEGTGHRVIVESTLATVQAANNRLRMLRKHNPDKVYTVEPVPTYTPKPELMAAPKFTVSRIPA